MAQTSTVQEPAIAALKWQVIETTMLGTRWVIAAFDVEEDAHAFVQAKTDASDLSEFECREDPWWVQLRGGSVHEGRELRRPVDVTERIEGAL